ELRSSVSPELGDRVAGRLRRAIRARRRHSVERVGHVDDPGEQGSGMPKQTVRIATTVGALVMELDDWDVGGKERHLAEDVRAQRGMRLDDLELVARERAVLL